MLSLASITQTIPSLAAMAILVPIFGIGAKPTLLILAFYAVYPILKNTVVGIHAIPIETIEAGVALGLNTWQRIYLVELPLAMPNIVAGVRIATAMTIGIATIAAFIGAGGLGSFITQGLALNDMKRVLLGAIPAALLALSADFLISLLERKLAHHSLSRRAAMFALIAVTLCIIISSFYFLRKDTASVNDTVVVGSKNFTEQYILAEIMAQILEAKTNLIVTRKMILGTTDMVHQAMRFGHVDIYPEYTGTAYLTILRETAQLDSMKIFAKVSEYYHDHFDIEWLQPFGFSNGQTIAVTEAIAKQYKLKTLSDLSHIASTIRIAAPAEFIERADAYPKLKRIYSLAFKEVAQMDPNLMYNAIGHGKVDAIVAFTTDGRLQQLGLIALDDDQNSAVPYFAAPVIRGEILRRYPEVKDALSQLAGSLDQKTMSTMNADVELNGRSPEEVAREFLHKSARAFQTGTR